MYFGVKNSSSEKPANWYFTHGSSYTTIRLRRRCRCGTLHWQRIWQTFKSQRRLCFFFFQQSCLHVTRFISYTIRFQINGLVFFFLHIYIYIHNNKNYIRFIPFICVRLYNNTRVVAIKPNNSTQLIIFVTIRVIIICS